MVWVRQFFVQVFSGLFILSLLALAYSVSIDTSLSKPDKLETWLSESKLYDHFVANLITQAQKSAANQVADTGSGPSLNSPVIQEAAKAAFTPAVLQSTVTTIIDANYAWLQGKTAAPEFKVDLTDAKQNFAKQVSAYVTTHLATLPKCTEAQLRALSPELDPLQITCVPANVNAIAEGQKIEQSLLGSDGFLGDPVITPQTLAGNKTDTPYYTKFSKAPRYYQLSHKLPVGLAVLAFIAALLVIFIAPIRRKGLRRVGWVLLEAGVVLIVSKFAADYAFTKVQNRLFDNANVGDLQQSLTVFIQRAETALLGVTLYFGIAYAVLGLSILIGLLIGRHKQSTPKRERQTSTELLPTQPAQVPESPKPNLVTDIGPRRPQAPGAPPLSPQPKVVKKPKLIQL
jgi:hypothetical protein